MATFRHILCPIDFSDFSRHALDHAVAIARRHGATVTALYVMPPMTALIPSIESPMYPTVAFTDEDLEQYRAEVEKFVASENGGVAIEVVAIQGDAAQEITWLAERGPADLIVMGTHGRSGFDRLLLGSVTEKVLRRAPCPVLTVPCQAPDAVACGPVLFSHILCAVDFSPSSMKALTYAASLATTATTLSLVHVVEPVSVFEPVMADPAGAAVVDDRLAHQFAHERLTEIAGTLPGAVAEIVAEGKPYREILRVAAERHADLIVIGVHGGGSGTLAFGSTTNHIVRQATCPVLSLRA